MTYYSFFLKYYRKAAEKMCADCKDFIAKGSKILDLGCGSGVIGKYFQDFFQAEVIGVDIEDKRVENIPFKIIDGVNLPFADNSFDTVLIAYVLHHASDPMSLLREAKRVTRKNIIIYEDLPEGFFGRILCGFHGITFNIFLQKKKQKHHFKKVEEWEEIFANLGLKNFFSKKIVANYTIAYNAYPVKRFFFVLEKK